MHGSVEQPFTHRRNILFHQVRDSATARAHGRADVVKVGVKTLLCLGFVTMGSAYFSWLLLLVVLGSGVAMVYMNLW